MHGISRLAEEMLAFEKKALLHAVSSLYTYCNTARLLLSILLVSLVPIEQSRSINFTFLVRPSDLLS